MRSVAGPVPSSGVCVENYRNLLEQMGGCVIELTLPGGYCTYCSQTSQAVFGYDAKDFLCSPFFLRHITHPGSQLYLDHFISGALVYRGRRLCEYDIVDPGGAKRRIQQMSIPVADHGGRAPGVVFVCWNMSTIEPGHEHSQTTLRLASMGTFAAGMAHEINNPLNSILLGARYALDSRRTPEYVAIMEQCLRDTIVDASRCGQIVKNLLKFANEEDIEKWPCDVNAVVRRSLVLCSEYAAASDVEIAQELVPGLPEVNMNPTAIGQVIVNLVRNGVDACRGGGRVTVVSHGLPKKVRLSVHDNGIGIAPDVRPHIFDPFFTTRREDGGTGLGLSVIRGILESHSAHIEVHYEEGGGTRFVVDFIR